MEKSKVMRVLNIVSLIIVILCVLFVLYFVVGFIVGVLLDKTAKVTIEESYEHFDDYMETIETYLVDNGYSFETDGVSVKETQDELCYYVQYKFDNQSSIQIYLLNYYDREEKFSISYYAYCETATGDDSSMDLDLLHTLVSFLSGYDFEKDEIAEVITQRNGEYGQELLYEQTVRNEKGYGFGNPVWDASYRRQPNQYSASYGDSFREEFHIVGLTKHGTK